MNEADWFSIGVLTGLWIAWITVRVARYNRDKRPGTRRPQS